MVFLSQQVGQVLGGDDRRPLLFISLSIYLSIYIPVVSVSASASASASLSLSLSTSLSLSLHTCSRSFLLCLSVYLSIYILVVETLAVGRSGSWRRWPAMPFLAIYLSYLHTCSLAFTRYCHCQYCVVDVPITGIRGGPIALRNSVGDDGVGWGA